MTPKERMMTALHGGKPDRLPATVHQWQAYHLDHYMEGCDQLEAFLRTGLDASVTPWITLPVPSRDWIEQAVPEPTSRIPNAVRTIITTPEGELSFVRAQDAFTSFLVEHPVSDEEEMERFLKYWPGTTFDNRALNAWYDRTGDAGIVRGFVTHWGQPGTWQDFVELVGTEEAILWAMDDPDYVHSVLQRLTDIKVRHVHERMAGGKWDLIEHGGGAASTTVISPGMFREFCIPYDRQVIAALKEEGFPVTYHTCGGMKAILGDIPDNGCTASETLSPPGVGGDLDESLRMSAKEVLGSRVSLIGGLDQGGILSEATPERVKAEVRALFESYGKDGGYICSAADHFFTAPVQNLKAFAEAARECRYA
jgi:uroporphyrinogen-III decarboxylase